MKVIEHKHILRIAIEYSNQNPDERGKVFKYLDGQFGENGYSIKRMGPNKSIEDGLMIVEVLND